LGLIAIFVPEKLSPLKTKASTSTHKKVVVLLLTGSTLRGYLNASALGRAEVIEILTSEGERQSISLSDIKSIYFVRELAQEFEPERKAFLSRPKLDGLWVRLRFRDEDVMEGIVGNNLLDLLDAGVQMTPPDLHGNTLRMFIPRSALLEMKVLGVVGVARRAPRAPRATGATDEARTQSKLFNE
jgi:hypothetical protein